MTAAGTSSPTALTATLLVLSALYVVHQFTAPPTPTSFPKAPFLVHVALTPQILTTLALYLPLLRWQSRLIFLPALFATYYSILGTGSPSQAPAYAIGTFVAVHCYRSLELLVFRDPYTFRWTASDPPIPYSGQLWQITDLQLSLRNTNWSHSVRDPHPDPRPRTQWLLRRIARLVLYEVYLDILCWYMRDLDIAFFVPVGHADSLHPPAAGIPYPTPWVQNPAFPAWDYPPPTGFPEMPHDPLKRWMYQAFLHTLRTCLSASAIFSTISVAYALVSVSSVLVGVRSWGRKESWPDVAGSPWNGAFGYGVKGWWGRGWHGLFRSIFTAPVDGCGFPKRGMRETVGYLVVPFVLSSGLHWAGAWSKGYMGLGCVAFFMLQPVGIVLEQILLGKHGKKPFRYLWTLFWFVVTSKMFFEEYRWGGLWATEPIPFSLIRWWTGRGFVVKEWGGAWLRWATAEEGGLLGEWALVVL